MASSLLEVTVPSSPQDTSRNLNGSNPCLSPTSQLTQTVAVVLVTFRGLSDEERGVGSEEEGSKGQEKGGGDQRAVQGVGWKRDGERSKWRGEWKEGWEIAKLVAHRRRERR